MLVRAAKQHSAPFQKLQQAFSTSTVIEPLCQWSTKFISNSSSCSRSSSCYLEPQLQQRFGSSSRSLQEQRQQQQQQPMTTGKPSPPHMPNTGMRQMHHKPAAAAAAAAAAAGGGPGRGPSPSSSASDMSGCCTEHRQQAGPHNCITTTSIKSTKRRAAEALLAARYSSSGGSGYSTVTGTATTVAAAAALSPAAAAGAGMTSPSPLAGRVLSFAASTAGAAGAAAGESAIAGSMFAGAQLQLPLSKRHKSTLSSVIDRMESATAANGSRSSSRSSSPTLAGALTTATQQQQQQQPHLTKLQQSLQQLKSVHERLQRQQHQQQPDSSPSEQQLQQEQQQEHPETKKPRLGRAAAEQQQQQQSQLMAQRLQQQHVVVQACGRDCSHSLTEGWCHTEVAVPHIDWARVLDADLSAQPSFRIATGYERLTMPDGLQVLVVENQVHLAAALQQLRASMQDPYIAIDLEWRPEFGRRFTPVALMQLASSTTAVLVRTCRMHYRLPPVLRAFLQDQSITLLGFGWPSSDEPKMQSTFGMGSRDFGRFMDLQAVAQGLGYCSFGLGRLTRHVLGLNLPKSKKISMSNWEAISLTRHQVKYAALDVLVAGQVFRALRLWHSSPSICEACHYTLGASSGTSTTYRCSCGKDFTDVRGYLQHCERAGHEPRFAECSSCGCSRRLPWPSGTAPGGGGGGGSSSSGDDGGGGSAESDKGVAT